MLRLYIKCVVERRQRETSGATILNLCRKTNTHTHSWLIIIIIMTINGEIVYKQMKKANMLQCKTATDGCKLIT